MKTVLWVLTIFGFLINSSWSSASSPTSSSDRPESCVDVRETNATGRDGRYTVYPRVLYGQPVAVYCHDMGGAPREYVTLDHTNLGVHPNITDPDCSGKGRPSPRPWLVGSATFGRIRVDIRTMVVNRTDFTFANTSGRPIPYGEATDCYTKHPSPTDPSAYRCGLKGYFLIDLTDTGLIIDPMTTWDLVGNSSSYNVIKDKTGQVQARYCGGYCGGCVPHRGIIKLVPLKVHGGWSIWTRTVIGTCSVSCGHGNQNVIKRRTCSNPHPRRGGRPCEGKSERVATEQCERICPVDGMWGPWMRNGSQPCSARCGRLGYSRVNLVRQCNAPRARYGGKACVGQTTKTAREPCLEKCVPVDGGWSVWTLVEKDDYCRHPCSDPGSWQVFYRRRCTNPQPSHGGRQCDGGDVLERCSTGLHCPDPVSGGWSAWARSATGRCSARCDRPGTRWSVDVRTCTDPRPSQAGDQCEGSASRNVTERCQAACKQVSGRPTSCSDVKTVGHQLKDGIYALYPPAVYGQRVRVYCHDMSGRPREYVDLPFRNVAEHPNLSDPDCTGRVHQTRRPDLVGSTEFKKIRVDIATMTVDRTDYQFAQVTGHPIPFGEASDCYTKHVSHKSCAILGQALIDLRATGFIVSPEVNWKPYGNYTAMKHKVVFHNQTHLIHCGGYCGGCSPVGGKITLVRFKVNGGWGSWERVRSWPCSVTCGKPGIQKVLYKRQCSSPVPRRGGRKCVGTSEHIVMEVCKRPCPVPGNWGSWRMMGNNSCSVTCGVGSTLTVLKRQCDNPPPKYGGQKCVGHNLKTQKQTCNIACAPVHGGWGSWVVNGSDWCVGECNKTGNHTVFLRRECDSSRPQHGGRRCSNGTDTMNRTEKCQVNCDTVAGGWSEWVVDKQQPCNVTCGKGSHRVVFRRVCDTPTPRHGGDWCLGPQNRSSRVTCHVSCPEKVISKVKGMPLAVIISCVCGIVGIAAFAMIVRRVRRKKHRRDDKISLVASEKEMYRDGMENFTFKDY